MKVPYLKLLSLNINVQRQCVRVYVCGGVCVRDKTMRGISTIPALSAMCKWRLNRLLSRLGAL